MRAANDFHKALRAATSELHTELDSLSDLQVFKGREVTRDTYARALVRLYRPHQYLEKVVSRMLDSCGYQYQSRAAALEKDLSELRQPIPEQPALSLFDVQDSAVWGYLYLLEGSKLGSAHIARLLHRNSPVALPTLFFAEGWTDPSSMQPFWQQSAICLDSSAKTEQAIEAACKAFHFYISAIQDGCLSPELLN
ncbi:MAG: biliverdin-producing heme oxygenase [Amphritea sp.]|nr:biliverdin-producing heme oxygenase [Amphritea sp.]